MLGARKVVRKRMLWACGAGSPFLAAYTKRTVKKCPHEFRNIIIKLGRVQEVLIWTAVMGELESLMTGGTEKPFGT